MLPMTKAVVESDIFWSADRRERAPRGLYTLELEDDFRVGFKRGGGKPKFFIPMDAVIMHVFEGHMRVVDGKLL